MNKFCIILLSSLIFLGCAAVQTDKTASTPEKNSSKTELAYPEEYTPAASEMWGKDSGDLDLGEGEVRRINKYDLPYIKYFE